MSTANKISAIYNDDDIASTIPIKQGMTVRMVHSLAGEDLQVDEARITSVVDADSELEPIAFSAQAPLVLSYDGTPMGKYYARELKQKNARSSELVAYSAIWLLKLKVQPERMYAYSNKSVATVLGEILGDVPHSIGSAYGTIMLKGKIPAGTSYSQLFEILLATGGSCMTGSEGEIIIDYPTSEISSVIGSDKLIQGGSVEKKSPLTYMSVTAYSFTKAKAAQTYTLSYQKSVTVSASAQSTVSFTTYYDEVAVSTSSTTVSGNTSTTTYFSFSVQHSTTSKTEVTVKNETSASRTFYIWCKKPNVPAEPEKITEYVYSIGTAPTGVDTDNAKSISGHYLITRENAQDVLSRMWRYYNKQETIKADIVCHGEKPGDVVSIMRPDTKEFVTATIKQADYKFGLQEYRATIEALVGFTPLSYDIPYTQTMLLTGDGNITVSQLSEIAGYDVTAFRVILVSSGYSGFDGKPGASVSGEIKSKNYKKEVVYPRDYNSLCNWINTSLSGTLSGNAVPSEGGAGGNPGQSGKIYDYVQYVVEQSETFRYTISNILHRTKFGEQTSENGKYCPEGFEIAGYTFGGRGNQGIRGGRGGLPGQPGESITVDGITYSGGQAIGNISKTENVSATYYIADGSTIYNGRFDVDLSITNIGGLGAAYGVDAMATTISVGRNGAHDDLRTYSSSVTSPDVPTVLTTRPSIPIPPRPSKVTQYGMGGHGGHGGGGVGAFSNWSYSFSNEMNLGITGSVTLPESSGGKGGEGGDGCILLLF